MASRVLMVGDPKHTQTDHQIKTLQNLDATVLVLNPHLLSPNDSLAWTDTRITINNQAFSPGQFKGVIIRSLPQEFPSMLAFERQDDLKLSWQEWFYQYCLQRDRHDTLLGLLLRLESFGLPFYNPPSRTTCSRRKPFQLEQLRNSGCRLPQTLCTNDPQKAQNFINHHQDVIVKPASGGALTIDATSLDFDQLQKIKIAPAIFQRRIFGKDVRVIVVDGRVISSVVVNVPDGTLDFRGNPSYQKGTITYTEVDLPKDVRQACQQATYSLGLKFCGIDLKLTDEGKHYFLECNSSPIYLDVEHKLGHPITHKLAEKVLQANP